MKSIWISFLTAEEKARFYSRMVLLHLMRNPFEFFLKKSPIKRIRIQFSVYSRTLCDCDGWSRGMTRVIGSSISRRIAHLNQKLMRCISYSLNNEMKSAMAFCAANTDLMKLPKTSNNDEDCERCKEEM